MKLITPFFLISLTVCFLISVYLAPYGKALSKSLIAEQSYEDQLSMLQPKTLVNLDNAETYLYFDSFNGNKMIEVTFFVQQDLSLSLVRADMLEISKEGSQMMLNFKNGYVYPNLNSPNKIDASFKELKHAIEVGQDNNQSFTLSKLLDYKEQSNFIQNQWNASIPLMLLALMLLSFVFGKENPRSGREGNLVTGVLIYIFYLSVLVAFRESYAPNWDIFYYLLWPVHGVFLFFGFVLFWLDVRVSLNRLFSYSRIRIILIIFLIFTLSAWLSS